MAFYRYIARYVFGDEGNDSYSIRSLVPFSREEEKNKYFDVSEAEQEELYAILETYGFRFPCV